MKKRLEATQTLRAGCSKTDPQTNTQGRLQYTAQVSAQCNEKLYFTVKVSTYTTKLN